MILMLTKHQFKKKNHVVQISQLNISLDNDNVIRQLYIKLPQMIRYVKCFDSNKTMSLKVIDNKVLKSTPKYGKKSAV